MVIVDGMNVTFHSLLTLWTRVRWTKISCQIGEETTINHLHQFELRQLLVPVTQEKKLKKPTKYH